MIPDEGAPLRDRRFPSNADEACNYGGVVLARRLRLIAPKFRLSQMIELTVNH
jgi:hypothetical protein